MWSQKWSLDVALPEFKKKEEKKKKVWIKFSVCNTNIITMSEKESINYVK